MILTICTATGFFTRINQKTEYDLTEEVQTALFKDIRKRASKSDPTRGIVVLLVVIVLMAAILIERLFYLQIIQGESYQE